MVVGWTILDSDAVHVSVAVPRKVQQELRDSSSLNIHYFIRITCLIRIVQNISSVLKIKMSVDVIRVIYSHNYDTNSVVDSILYEQNSFQCIMYYVIC